MVFLVLAALVTVSTAATVWLAASAIRRKNDPDAPFWYTFTGLCIVMPMVLIPAMKTPTLSGTLALTAAVTAVGTHFYSRRHAAVAAANEHSATLAATVAQTSAQHKLLVARWSRYELDPGAAIDFPAMSDVRIPETAALIRAVVTARHLSPAAGAEPLMDDDAASYQQAVAELAAALETAEAAAQHSNC